MIGVRGLHEMIVATFGGQPDRSGSRLTAQASAVLAAERDERGRTPVLVIDEAHLLRYEQLEAIRMLTLCRDRDYAGGRQGALATVFTRVRRAA
jgi:type II secretory pathway predicted ATPase ExeA